MVIIILVGVPVVIILVIPSLVGVSLVGQSIRLGAVYGAAAAVSAEGAVMAHAAFCAVCAGSAYAAALVFTADAAETACSAFCAVFA